MLPGNSGEGIASDDTRKIAKNTKYTVKPRIAFPHVIEHLFWGCIPPNYIRYSDI